MGETNTTIMVRWATAIVAIVAAWSFCSIRDALMSGRGPSQSDVQACAHACAQGFRPVRRVTYSECECETNGPPGSSDGGAQ